MTVLFVGLELPGTVTDQLVADLQALWSQGHDVAWTRPTGWHVTLAYLGETDVAPSEVAGLLAPVAAGLRRPQLAVRGTLEWFDRAAVLPVADDGWCREAGAAVQGAIADADLPVVRRSVDAHVTLARRRGRRGDDRGSSLTPEVVADVLGPDDRSWTATSLSVFRSVTGDGPASYPVVAEVPLP